MVKLKSGCGLNKTHFWLHFFLAFLNVVLYSTLKKLNLAEIEAFRFQALTDQRVQKVSTRVEVTS
jgi:hypothetical protein